MTDPTALSATALVEAIATRRLSAAETMAAFLDRIERINPGVNALVSLRPRAALMAEAEAADRQAGHGPLHGLPIAIKDLENAAGLPTTQGSPLFRDALAEADSPMVARLRAAGAIIIGKTNVPEFGFGSHTYNPIFGTTRNAYDQSRSAGGSSGGAAVALATRMLPLADGSDHGGSLRNPAAFNNIYGMRPSFGRIPAEAMDAFAASPGVLGPMARSVEDLALLLAVQAGPDPAMPLSIRQTGAAITAPLDTSIAGRRIGWLGDLGGYLAMEPGILALCEEGLRVLEDLGCIVEPLSLGFSMAELWEAWTTIRSWGIAAALGEAYADPAKRPLLKPEAQWEVARGLALSGQAVSAALAARTRFFHHLRGLFARFDHLALPSAQVFPFPAEWRWPQEIAGRAMDSYHRWMEVVVPATAAQSPAISLPLGFDGRGLPMGMQILGPYAQELSCLQLAAAYDRATRWPERRKPPLAA
ncbi:amidase [Acidisoma sp. C75]